MASTYLKVKSAKCLLFCFRRSWSCYFGLGLKNLVLFTSLSVCQTHSWWGLLFLPQEIQGPWRLRPRFSALRASFGSLFQQSSFSRLYKSLDKNTGSAHFRSQRMHQNAGSCIKNIPKKFRGFRPRSRRGDICSHPPPDAGAPPLLLGWLRPCRQHCQV